MAKIDISSYGLKVDKKGKFYYGNYQGYYFFISNSSLEKSFILTLTAKRRDETKPDVLLPFLEEQCRELSNFKSYTYANNKLRAHFAMKGIETVLPFLEVLAKFLKENDYINCCSDCGTENFLSAYKLNGIPATLCSSCFSKTSLGDSYRQDRPSNQVNAAAGLIGALIGSLIGVAVWVFIYALGYIAGIAGFIITMLAMKGYEKLGGGMNKAGVIISLFITIIMVFFAQYCSLGWEIYQAYNYIPDVHIMNAMASVPDFLVDSKILAPFLKDLIIGYVLTALVSFSYLAKSFRMVSNTAEEAMKLD